MVNFYKFDYINEYKLCLIIFSEFLEYYNNGVPGASPAQ